MRFAAVLLDWGGTITPSHDSDLHDLWRLVAYEVAPAHVVELTARLVRAERQWWRDAVSHLRSGSLTEVVASASATLGVDVAPMVARATGRRDIAAWTPRTIADPEALLLVHLLRARGLRVGLLTNTHWPASWHARLLARDGLLNLFHAQVYADDLPVRKPHPMVFQAALAALGVDDPSRVVHLGDRLDADVAGAAAVGMCTVLLAHSGSADSGSSVRVAADRVLAHGMLVDGGLADGLPAHGGRGADGRGGGAGGGPGGGAGGVRPDRVVRRLGHLLDALTSMERLPPTPRRSVELPAIPTL